MIETGAKPADTAETNNVRTLNAVLQRRGAGWLMWMAVVVAYAVAYSLHELNPGFGPEAVRDGWWTWSDQQRYLQQAEAIARGEVNAQTYFYPLGYAVLAAPFVGWLKAHAFFVPNVLLFSAAAAVWYQLARRWFSPIAALGIGGAFVVTHTWLVADTMVVPWNTLPTQLTLLAGIWILVTRRGAAALWMMAGLAAATYLVRPMDAAAFGPLLIWATLRLPTWRMRVAHGLGGIGLILAAWAGVGMLNLSVFGSWRTPYELASMQHLGFFGYPVSFKLYWIFVEGMPHFGEVEPALLWRYPWMFLFGGAAIWWLRRDGVVAAAALASVVVSAGSYVNYNDFTPAAVYRFTLIHYLAWWFPLMFLVAAAAVWHGRADRAVRVGWAIGACAFALFAGLRLEPKTERVARQDSGWRLPEDRPVLVRFEQLPLDTVDQLRLDGRKLIEVSEYLVPYVPSELRVLIRRKARGEWLDLTFASEPRTITAEIGRYEWRWRISVDRVRKITRRLFQHAWH